MDNWAHKKLSGDGEWEIRFDPFPAFNGTRWNSLHGFVDEEVAQMVVDLLNARETANVNE